MSPKKSNSQEKLAPYIISLSIVLAGFIVGGAVLFASSQAEPQQQLAQVAAPAEQHQPEETVETPIRGVQPEDHIKGDPNASVTLVEYSDFECPFCKRFHSTLDQIVEDDSVDVNWVYRHFPLESLHPKATPEAIASECAFTLGGNDGFWRFADRLYEITPSNNGFDLENLSAIAEFAELDVNEFNSCIEKSDDSRVQTDFEEAIAAGGRGTPFNVLILEDGTQIPFSGALPYNDVISLIQNS